MWVDIGSLLESIFEYHLQSNLISQKPAVTLEVNKRVLKKDLKLYTDEVRLKQVFDNLLTNAIKNTLVGCVEYGLFEVSEERNEITFLCERFRNRKSQKSLKKTSSSVLRSLTINPPDKELGWA